MLHLDTSALVKIVVEEPGTAALRTALRATGPRRRTSSALTRTELVRAVSGRGEREVAAARWVLDGLVLVTTTADLLDAAAALSPATLRSLDAIHVATALELGAELRGVVTCDDRMVEAARHHGLATLSPR